MNITPNPTISWDTFRVIVIRDVTSLECNWLNETIVAGTELFVGNDAYGVCSKDGSGIPVSYKNSEYTFEIPISAVIGVIEK